MEKDELMLKIDNVSKIYKLGEIGGTTLREEFQRLWARLRKKEDPTKKIGAKNYKKGEEFKALDNISFEVKKGERIGIIGHNGAGKSTLLKLISRVTGPSDGTIFLNGRVASMLEVGTGFHPELTGRENVYMNGAILGMTKKEIDSKMEDIIDFSEVRQFIDTPVKRYSSGMYVKLAFSVAAHLDSEIMIMDEVLAVGDVAFQNKCIKKMQDVSERFDRTILYVSHNMSTIKELCNRVIVLNHGTIVFDGDVDTGISQYLGLISDKLNYQYTDEFHPVWKDKNVTIKTLHLLEKELPSYCVGERIKGKICVESLKDYEGVRFAFILCDSSFNNIGTSYSDKFDMCLGQNIINFDFDTSALVHGRYVIHILIFETGKNGAEASLDAAYCGLYVNIDDSLNEHIEVYWDTRYWGHIHLKDIIISKDGN